MTTTLAYRRVLLKLSGEAFGRSERGGIEPGPVLAIAQEMKRVCDLGVKLGVVMGAGNFIRGAIASGAGLNRTTADHMGMLATIINALSLQDACDRLGFKARIFSTFAVDRIVEGYDRRRALEAWDNGFALILPGGTGNPFFTTDTAAALRAVELEAEILLKATKVDGVYSADPKKDKQAKRYTTLSYRTAIEKQLKVMDLAALTLCMENGLPTLVFDMRRKGNIERAVRGEKIGTLVK